MGNFSENIASEKESYSPTALLNTFSNSLVSPLLNKVFIVKGVFKKGKGVNYNGVYYDILKDESSDSSITFVIPEIIRIDLKEGQIVEAQTYFTKRLSATTGRIDLILNVSTLLSQKEKVVDEKTTKALGLIRRKAQIGYKDVDSIIKSKLYQQQPIVVTIIIGTTAVIDDDIKYQLKDASLVYNIRYVKTNLTRIADISHALQQHDDSDILVISRGGGENIQIFDNPELSQVALSLQAVFVTAIGHAVDEPLLQKIADKHFITPTALGQYFHDIYTRTTEELTNSKARLINDLTKQIEVSFQSKVQDLNNRLAETTRLMQESNKENETKLQRLSEKLSKSKLVNYILITLILIISILLIVYFFRQSS